MLPNLQIRQAEAADTAAVAAILSEAAAWLEERGLQIWRETELSDDRIASDVAAGLFFLAEIQDPVTGASQAAGVLIFQLEDRMFWPDATPAEAAYLHRFAVRRAYAGGAFATEMLRWAAQRAHTLGRRYLRMDCFADRPRLRAVYERFGFQYCDDRQVGPYHVARYQYDVSDLYG